MRGTSEHLEPLRIPKVYAYTEEQYEHTPWRNGKGEGLLKVGYTTQDDAEKRVKQQFPVIKPGETPYKIALNEISVADDGSAFQDHQVHVELDRMGFRHVAGEWYEATKEDVLEAINNLRAGKQTQRERNQTFAPRPEQQQAIKQTAEWFRQHPKSKTGVPPHYLWNAKMRFGKTFTTYQLAKQMGWTRLLVLTFKPAVEASWEEDLLSHRDFDGWQFIGKGQTFDGIDETKPYVWFASFQDILGNTEGEMKQRHEELFLTDWDCVVIDEYHFGAWNERAKELYDSAAGEKPEEDDQDLFSEDNFPLSVGSYLYLSGTPFRSLVSGEFAADEIFSWTYTDEQRAKQSWKPEYGANPYLELPKMVMLTYQMPKEIRQVAQTTDANEFDLNEFFAAKKNTDEEGNVSYKFAHPNEVGKWLGVIRGDLAAHDANLGSTDVVKPPMPFNDADLLGNLLHTLWFLPSVASCYAMREMLQTNALTKQFYNGFRIVVAAGKEGGSGMAALPPVKQAMTDTPTETRTITLTCGKLTTGVSVPPWTGIFMLRNTSTPETYFQSAFRVQTPWVAKTGVDTVEGGQKREIIKETCYVFDFAPQRALSLVVQYSTQLASDRAEGTTVEEQVNDFLNFLPVLCYTGFAMEQLDAGPLLDFAATGTGAKMLAAQWQSARLIGTNTEVLAKLKDHPDLVERLSELESFRNLRDLGDSIVRTVNNDDALNRSKANSKNPKAPKPTSQQTAEEKQKQKDNKAFRDELMKSLKLLAARLPVFMYLTDEREETVADVIAANGELFERATNISQADFALLCELGVFNKATMDSAVYAFRRFEIASLDYIGGGKELPTEYGGLIDSHAAREDVIDGTV